MTTRIALVVTGDLELLALHESLGRVFEGADIEWVPTQKTDCFTSCELQGEPILRSTSRAGLETPSNVAKLASALVAAADPGRAGRGADLAVAIEDVELCNRTKPERIVQWFRAAVDAVVRDRWSSSSRGERGQARVRDRCSFHLFAPMTEAYLFGEPDALARAGAQRPARVDPGLDLELFETEDPDYLNTASESEHRENLAWHPKLYLQFLCNAGGYKETKGGVKALKSLQWSRPLARLEHLRFARSLFDDIADVLGIAAPFPGATHPLTTRRSNGVLRNL